ncbi:hypothetical protein CVIRNUC_004669 [Coccomyxa viridis]|uniref:Uncharacterized protein n=1 Tax=Coccomyxa viridis TaxID=1274662 RepID=A0AAV1I357_9CHLO|nr:hypothetical protein CVIRNUC_004669 [Coccomyxa viridis]
MHTNSMASEACFVSHYRHKQHRYSPFLQPFPWSLGSQRANLLSQRCRAIQDPLQDAMYETWSSSLDDWDSREYEDSELIDALYMEEGGAGTTAQNVLAIALALLLVAAVGNVVFKIVLVSWALFSAAVRYSAVALILICMGTLLA